MSRDSDKILRKTQWQKPIQSNGVFSFYFFIQRTKPPRGRSPAELNGKAEKLSTLTDCRCGVERTRNPRCLMEWYASAPKLPACNMTKKSANCVPSWTRVLVWNYMKLVNYYEVWTVESCVREKLDPSLTTGKWRILTWLSSRRPVVQCRPAPSRDAGPACRSSGLCCRLTE